MHSSYCSNYQIKQRIPSSLYKSVYPTKINTLGGPKISSRPRGDGPQKAILLPKKHIDNMSYLTYNLPMSSNDKPLVWMHGEITTPPFSENARIEAGYLLRQLQKGLSLSLPQSRPMPSIGTNCHELRINDGNLTWRIIYKIYTDAILILEVFRKKTNTTPKSIIDICKQRIKHYNTDVKGDN